MNARLASWKTKFLNMAGRSVLAKSTLSSMPTYLIHYIRIPSRITDSINKIQRDFVWESSNEKKKLHLLNWEIHTSDKRNGGLGLHKSDLRNRALYASLA